MPREDDWLAQQMREEGYHPLAGESRAAEMLRADHERKCTNKHMKTGFNRKTDLLDDSKKIKIFFIGLGIVCLLVGGIIPAIIFFYIGFQKN